MEQSIVKGKQGRQRRWWLERRRR